VLRALKNCRKVDQKTLKLIAHILGSEFVWYGRLTGDLAKANLIWPEWSIENCPVSLKKANTTGLTF